MNFSLFFLASAAIVSTVSGKCDIPAAAEYVILAKTGISTVPQSLITGNIAASPIASTAITGFTLIIDSSNMFSTSTQVTGNVYAPDYTGGSDLITVISQMETAYDDAASRDTSANVADSNLGGQTLESGVYTFDVDVSISGGDLTFSGSATDVFIIQTSKNIIQAAATNVILAGGAKAENIFWSVAQEVNIGAGAHMKGILLAATAVKFITGSNFVGRVLAATAVTIQQATITDPTAATSSQPTRRGLRGLQVA